MCRPGLSINLFSFIFTLIALTFAHQSMATDFGGASETITSGTTITDGLNGLDNTGDNPPTTLTIESGAVVNNSGSGTIGVNFNAFNYILSNQGSITGNTIGVNADDEGTVNNENSIIGLGGAGIFITNQGFVTNDVAGATIDGQSGNGVYIGSGTVSNGGLASMIMGSTNGVFIFGNGSVFNSGQDAEITGDGGDGVNIGSNASAGGAVFNTGAGAKITGSVKGVFIDGTGTVSNTGDGATITGSSGQGVHIMNGVATVTNGVGATITGNGAPAIETHTSNDIITNDGTLTSDQEGIMTRAGMDTITVSGTINSGGGINAISAGNDEDTVNIEDGANINGDIGGGETNATDTINLSGTGTFSHRIKAFSQLNVDNGFWTLDGSESHNVAETDINSGGTLFLDSAADVLDGNATVNAGGMLAGNGTIAGSLTTIGSGIVSPGASIGTIFADSLDMSGGGTLEIEFDNAGNSDVIEITNGTILSGGSVNFLPLDPGFSGTQTYRFIDANDPTVDTFSSFSISPLFMAEIFYDATFPGGGIGDVGVTISRPNTFPQLANTANRLPIAQILEDNLPTATGDIAEIITAISSVLTLDDFYNALDQLSPEVLASIPRLRFMGHRNFKESLVQRMGALRFGNNSSNNQGVAQLAFANIDPSLLPNFVTAGPRIGSTAKRSGWKPFFKAVGAVSDLDSNVDHFGFESSTAGVIIGADNKVNRNITIGGAGGYTSTDTDFDNFDTQSNMDTFNLAVFGEFAANNFRLDAVLSYAHTIIDMNRQIIFGGLNRTAVSDHHGNEFLVHAGAGYDFNVAGWLVGPLGHVEYAALIENDFDERGAGAANLMVEGRTTDSFRTVAGIRATRQYQFRNMLLVPEAHGRWTHEWLDNPQTLQAQFINMPGAAFNISSQTLADDGGNVGASLTAFKNEMAFNISYDTEFRGDLISHAFDVGLKVNF